MTSIPASRRARAITLAPRSWPSRPGLAMTTRVFRMPLISSGAHDEPCTAPAGLQVQTSYPIGRGGDPIYGRSWAQIRLNRRGFLLLAPHVAQGVAHFADRRVRAYTFEQRVHGVPGAPRRLSQVGQS